jgi:hypothetical protein
MKLDYRIVCMTLAMCGLSATALAQDEPMEDPMADPAADPTAGDMGGGDLGGEATADEDMAPPDDAGGGGTDKPISVKLLVGYGLSLEDGPNFFGLGFGAGAGYNLDQIYLGLRFVYSLGEDPVSAWELGVEGGYDVDLGGATLRPGLGLGIYNVTVSVPSFMGFGGGSVSSSELYIAPGVAALFDVSDSIFLGAEARFVMILAGSMIKELSLLAHAGMRF